MDALLSGARALLNLELTPAQVAAFQTYADELRAWNEQFNLTAITDPQAIQVKHFLDSLTLLRVLPAAGPRLNMIDVGTGAGFPGLPLKLVWPALQLTLVEATGKKAKFCRHIVDTLKLSGVTIVHARAEEIGRDRQHRERYDWAVARAVAEMPVLAEYLLPLLKRGGYMAAQKGKDAPAETYAGTPAIQKLGGELDRISEVELPGIAEPRYLVVLKKVAATPPQFPRRPGLPAKEPLK
ncbi:MAG: 16S rRNA (guanine(527)-N(7))-methyltransferase RsmG [Anaerolineales bacterium]|nr:16S rRNA (guanine(527)-N(7))-methyltransferase RsmG [Anaerolineales bacterium]